MCIKKVNPIRLIISFQHKLFRKGKKCFAGQGKTECILKEIFLAFILQHEMLKKIKCDFIKEKLICVIFTAFGNAQIVQNICNHQ